jgi:peptidyl-tRNA hydrolase, PTH1 family
MIRGTMSSGNGRSSPAWSNVIPWSWKTLPRNSALVASTNAPAWAKLHCTTSYVDMTDQLAVSGFGNPDSSFASTRHIVGRFVVELLANGRRHRCSRTGADLLTKRLGDPSRSRRIGAYPRGTERVWWVSRRAGENPSRSTSASAHPHLDIPFGTLGVSGAGGDQRRETMTTASTPVRAARRTGEFCRVSIGLLLGRLEPAMFGRKPWSTTEQGELPFVDRAADALRRSLPAAWPMRRTSTTLRTGFRTTTAAPSRALHHFRVLPRS